MEIKFTTVSDAKNIYIDIDGVLLCNRTRGRIDPAIANYAHEFLEVCLKGHDCYWLSTHCSDGSAEPALRWLSKYADESFMELARQIKPVTWNTMKTDAIDFTQPFLWIDDGPTDADLDVLRSHDSIHRWIHVDTFADPNGLKRVIKTLSER